MTLTTRKYLDNSRNEIIKKKNAFSLDLHVN